MTYSSVRKQASIRRKQWRITRHEIWVRDKCRCQHCGQIVPFYHVHIDHIKPVSCGGTNHKKNLRTLCFLCHSLRRDPSHIRVRERARRKGVLPSNWVELLWGEVYETKIKKYKEKNASQGDASKVDQ